MGTVKAEEKKLIEMELPVDLPADALEDIDHKVRALTTEETALERDLDAYTRPKRQRLREVRKERRQLADEAEKGKGMRMCPVEVRYVFEQNKVEFWRMDTAPPEHLKDKDRAMTAEERQQAMFADVPEGANVVEGGKGKGKGKSKKDLN